MKKKVIIIFILAVVVSYFVAKKWPVSEEALVRKVIASFERAAEAENLRKCVSHISKDYSGEIGFDYQSAMFLGRDIFNTYDDIFIHVKGLKIEVKGKEAKATFVATVFATRSGTQQREDLLRERGSDRFVVTFRKEEGGWKVLSSEVPGYTFE